MASLRRRFVRFVSCRVVSRRVASRRCAAHSGSGVNPHSVTRSVRVRLARLLRTTTPALQCHSRAVRLQVVCRPRSVSSSSGIAARARRDSASASVVSRFAAFIAAVQPVASRPPSPPHPSNPMPNHRRHSSDAIAAPPPRIRTDALRLPPPHRQCCVVHRRRRCTARRIARVLLTVASAAQLRHRDDCPLRTARPSASSHCTDCPAT